MHPRMIKRLLVMLFLTSLMVTLGPLQTGGAAGFGAHPSPFWVSLSRSFESESVQLSLAAEKTYVEDFDAYSHKAYAQNADWDIFRERLALLPLTGGAHREPFIALDGQGGAYVAWGDLRNNDSNGDWDIYAQHIDDRGNRLWATDLRVNSDATDKYQGMTSIAVDSQGNAVIVWVDDREENGAVYAQKISPTGTKLWRNDIRVNGAPAYRMGSGLDILAIASDQHDNVFVVWQGNRDNDWDPDVYAQKISSSGRRLWPTDVRVNDDAGDAQRFMDVDADARGYVVVAWVDDRNGGEDIYVQRMSPNGNRMWSADVKVSSGVGMSHQGNPNVIIDSQGNAVIIWRTGRSDRPIDGEPSSINAQKIDANGVLLWEGGITVNQETSDVFRGRPHAAAIPNGDVIVAWEDDREYYGNSDIYVQRLSSTGTRLWDKDLLINPKKWYGQRTPRVAVDGDSVFFTWMKWDEIYAQVLDLAKKELVLPTPALVNETGGSARQYEPDAAYLSGGRAMIVWGDYRRNKWDIRAQTVDRSGRMVWPDSIQINDDDESVEGWRPRIAANTRDRALIVWNDSRGGTYGQLVDVAGNRLWETDKRINADNRPALFPNVVAMPDNTFVITYLGGRDWDSNLWDIYLQRVDEEGNQLWDHDVRANVTDYFDNVTLHIRSMNSPIFRPL